MLDSLVQNWSAGNKTALIAAVRSLVSGEQEIYVFGSRVMGFIKEGSDLDLAIVATGTRRTHYKFNFNGMKARLAVWPEYVSTARGVYTLPQYRLVAGDLIHVDADEISDWIDSRIEEAAGLDEPYDWREGRDFSKLIVEYNGEYEL